MLSQGRNSCFSSSLDAPLRHIIVQTRPLLGQVLSMHLLVPLVVVPMASSVGTDVALEGLFTCVPEHVPFQVHTLVAGVGAEAAAEWLVA